MDENESLGPDKEIPGPLSALYKGTFAYFTIRDRLPVILTKVVDGLVREKDTIVDKYGQESREELKDIIGRLSKLKNEIQTDKPVELIADSWPDADSWNECINRETNKTGSPPSWFSSPWLLVECYMYRRIYESFQLSTRLTKFDPFAKQKEEALLNSTAAAVVLATYLSRLDIQPSQHRHKDVLEREFHQFIYLSLWGNKCDLSLSAGMDNSQSSDPLNHLESLQKFILVDDTLMIWNRLQHCISNCDGRVRLDVVLDNAGFELFTDMCLVDFLCSSNLVQEVYFHLKELPWFVSDATARDIEWTLQTLISFPDQPLLRHLGFKWQKFIETERWKMTSDPFWTLPHDFSVMNTVAPDLYTTLSQSHLVIFKGDLNYRKLTGDLMWDHTTAFHRALRGFHPTALCSLRTIKAEVVVGLKPLQAEATRNLQENWMTSSDFALIQFYANKF